MDDIFVTDSKEIIEEGLYDEQLIGYVKHQWYLRGIRLKYSENYKRKNTVSLYGYRYKEIKYYHRVDEESMKSFRNDGENCKKYRNCLPWGISARDGKTPIRKNSDGE